MSRRDRRKKVRGRGPQPGTGRSSNGPVTTFRDRILAAAGTTGLVGECGECGMEAAEALTQAAVVDAWEATVFYRLKTPPEPYLDVSAFPACGPPFGWEQAVFVESATPIEVRPSYVRNHPTRYPKPEGPPSAVENSSILEAELKRSVAETPDDVAIGHLFVPVSLPKGSDVAERPSGRGLFRRASERLKGRRAPSEEDQPFEIVPPDAAGIWLVGCFSELETGEISLPMFRYVLPIGGAGDVRTPEGNLRGVFCPHNGREINPTLSKIVMNNSTDGLMGALFALCAANAAQYGNGALVPQERLLPELGPVYRLGMRSLERELDDRGAARSRGIGHAMSACADLFAPQG